MSIGIDQLVGTELAGYRIESLLGRGGMGVVYLAEDLRLKRRVALKLVAPELAADARFRERFLREAELAASLDHSHVVPVYAAGELDGQLWIAMRYVQGTDLKALLEREGPLEPVRTLELCSQVAEALDAAHLHGLVHRDVKPANVLVTEEGASEHCYLTDFGLARSGMAEAGPPNSPHLSGTVDYTAPEQIAREPADYQADVYSLGCVLYECLAGEPPFRRTRAVATLFAHASEPPPSLQERRPELPEAIDAVIAEALAKTPEERYRSCRELCEAGRIALGIGAPRFSRRQLVLASGGAALVIATAASVPAILLGSSSEDPLTPPTPILPVTKESLVRIDPRTGEAVAAIPLGSQPVGLAVGEGSVWVIDSSEQTLSRIDPERNRVVGTVSLSIVEESPSLIAAGEGAVWTLFPFSGLKYDPITGSLSAPWNATGTSFSTAAWSISYPYDVAAGAGAVWVSGAFVLHRLDPGTGAISDTLAVERLSPNQSGGPQSGGPGIWVAVGESDVWAVSEQGFVARIDPATNRLMDTSEVSEALHGVATGEGAVWAIDANSDSVLRIDPATLRVTDTVRVGRSPTTVAAGAGAVWATSERDGTLSRLDPATFDVRTIDLGGKATDVAAGLGGVWVTVDMR